MNNKIITIFLGGIFLLLLYFVFKNDISNYLKKQEILKKSNIFNLVFVYSACENSIKNRDDNGECKKTLDTYQDDATRYKELINSNRVSCNDFKNQIDAYWFYQFINSAFVENYKKYGTAKLEHCTYDPYNLDSDNDCSPCENLNYY